MRGAAEALPGFPSSAIIPAMEADRHCIVVEMHLAHSEWRERFPPADCTCMLRTGGHGLSMRDPPMAEAMHDLGGPAGESRRCW
jgi:hypothetical protein